MAINGKTIGRIIFSLTAIAMLAGFTARAASAQDPWTVASRASQHTQVCLAAGGTVTVAGSHIICNLGNGHGFNCDVGGTLDDCQSWIVKGGASIGVGTVVASAGSKLATAASEPTQTPEPYATAAATISPANVLTAAPSVTTTPSPAPKVAASETLKIAAP